jgi:hypothetical protein
MKRDGLKTIIKTKNNKIMEFTEFPKMARFSREIVITEKIDGTNAQVLITEDGDMFFGSRTKWITPEDDNAGFARWAVGNRDELLKLGPGRHFGEWWGSGIQRGYGLPKGEKRFSLFNVGRWCLYGKTPKRIETADPRIEKYQEVLPESCLLVPEIYRGSFNTQHIDTVLETLKENGSYAAPGFMRPEGIVIFHIAGNVGFKKTIEKDEIPKSKH